MVIDYFMNTFTENTSQDAIIWKDRTFSYGWLHDQVLTWQTKLSEMQVSPGMVIGLEADFSPNAVALLLALIEQRCIIVPLSSSVAAKFSEFQQIAEVEMIIRIDEQDQVDHQLTGRNAEHRILMLLKEQGEPGLILFSSGTSGKSKAAVHNLAPLLEKFKVKRHAMRTLTFLLFDHIGGVNTLLYTLSNGGCVVTVQDRTPDTVLRTIETYKVESLPTSPTFLNMILLSESYKRYDLSHLKLVTYGTEVMLESTLRRFHALFPNIRLLQTYGLSEVGILRSKSKSSSSLWVKVGGEGFETRVVDGMLEIKAQSAMLGYLNAESPFTEDGWFKTGDVVEVDGEYLLIRGRRSEIINVGGEKVYPAEVESVLQQMDGVEDVSVVGEANPITGQIIKAAVKLRTEETLSEFRKRMRDFCKDKLRSYQIPQKVVFVAETMHGARFKKNRNLI